MVESPASDFGTMFKKFLESPEVTEVLETGRRVIQEDKIRGKDERMRFSHLNNPLD